MYRRAATIVLVAVLTVAAGLTGLGALLGTSPHGMVIWMLGSLATLAVGMFVYGRLTRH